MIRDSKRHEVVDGGADETATQRRERFKRERVEARPVGDLRGEFMEVPKDQLLIDPKYQRAPKATHFKRIARDFQWPLFGALTVSRRLRKELFAIDGQQRKLAADLIPSITTLPCMVFDLSAASEEAIFFAGIQNNRVGLLPNDNYRALIAAGDPVALIVARLFHETGYHADKSASAGQSWSVTCLSRILSEVLRDTTLEGGIWHLIAAVCDGASPGTRFVAGMCHLQRKLVANGETLCSPRIRSRLIQIGYRPIVESMAKADDFLSGYKPSVWGEGIRTALNKGCSKNFVGNFD